MPCPRCQHENRPQARFCEECASPLNVASSTARSDADPTSEVESLRRALTEALEQQTVTRVERRGFIVGTLGLLAAPLAVEAQQVGKVYRIGFLRAGEPLIDAQGRRRPPLACWACGREVAPMRFRADDLRRQGWASQQTLQIPDGCGCSTEYLPVPAGDGWWQLVPIWEPDQTVTPLRRYAPPEPR